MTIVNKILNVLILLLAVAACVAAVLLHERRIELRKRADVMADILAKTAEITDGEGETSSELNVADQLHEKSLDWESFHKSLDKNGKYGKWISNARTIEEKLKILYSMKIDLADALIKTAESLEYQKPEELRASMNSVNSYSEFTKQIHEQAAKVRTRDDRLASALVQVSTAIKKAQTVDQFKVLSKDEKTADLDGNIDNLIGEAGKLFGRAKLLASGLNDLKKAFVADLDGEVLFTPKWNSEAFGSENTEDISSAFAELTGDLKTLNGELYKLKIARKTIDSQQVQLTRQVKTIEEINIVNDDLKNINGALKAKVFRLEKHIIALELKIPKDRNPVRVAGKVVEADDHYNFIVINRGKEHGLVLGAHLLVHDNGKFICQVKATRVLGDKAVCEILASSTRAQTTDNGLVPRIGAQVVTVSE